MKFNFCKLIALANENESLAFCERDGDGYRVALENETAIDDDGWALIAPFTALLANDTNPETAGAYFTRGTNAYADGDFSRANFQKARFTGNWSGMTGFAGIVPQKGFHIAWKLDAKPLTVDGYGTVDMTIGEKVMVGECKCIPIGPTGAQIDAAQQISTPMGQTLSASSADLALASAGYVVTLKSASLASHSVAWGAEPLRVNETLWRTTRGFADGVPAPVASVAAAA